LGVCRRILPEADADDAFQGTFLILARKAASLGWHESVANWLYLVAYRLALKVKTEALRRRAHESQATDRPPRDPMAEISLREAQAVLDEELASLPDKLRAPVLLCCLEGMTRDEAARLLGWSLGTFKRRLEQGRERLRARLLRRGLSLPAALFGTLLGGGVSRAALSAALTTATVQDAVRFAAGAGPLVEGSVTPAARLAQGLLHGTVLLQMKVATAAVLAMGAVAAAAGGIISWNASPAESKGPEVLAAATPEPRGEKTATVRYRNRERFAQAMARVKEGMTEKEVLALLGRPDDIRTQHDPGGISTSRTKEIWCYGTNGHLAFPTLGCVYMDRQARAQYVHGGRGMPPAPDLISEAELLPLLRLIDRLPSYNEGHRYDPLRVIQVVNALQPLGKTRALAVVDEYLRVASHWHGSGREGLFFVLRVLFEVPEVPGHMPGMYVGGSSPSAPEEPRLLPQFPILLVDDIPLTLVGGYALAGKAQAVEDHVEHFRKDGVLRGKPLAPTNAPLRSFDKVRQAYRAAYGKGAAKYEEAMVRSELLRLVDSVYRLEPDGLGFDDDSDKRWQKHVAAVAKLDIRWHAGRQRYTYKDGSHLVDLPRKLHRREIWKLEGLEGEAQLIIERRDGKLVDVTYEWEGPTGTKLKPAVIKVLAVKIPKKPLAELRPSSLGATAGDTSYSSQSCQVELPEGEEMQAKLSFDKDEKVSPVYKP
jgi:RNA polymerase sigma factor (sigma-70 family)